jgi:paired small multidrug resistance pump
MEWFYKASGFFALAMFLTAYATVNLGVWHESQKRFHVVNMVGAVAMMVSLIGQWNLPIFVLECFWLAIGAYGLRKAYKA